MGIVLVQTDDTLESALNFSGDTRLFWGGSLILSVGELQQFAPRKRPSWEVTILIFWTVDLLCVEQFDPVGLIAHR